jgi:hypothetical protein
MYLFPADEKVKCIFQLENSVFEKTGEINKAAAVFKAIRETEQGADEMAFSHMIHCYGTAGCSPLPHLFISDLLP